VAEITAHLANGEKIDPAGADAYGLTALHKFASWNKTELLALLLPTLTTPEQLNARDPEGKTALHWAVEMASVGAVKALVRAGLDRGAEDGKGRTVGAILDAVEQSGVIERLKKALVIEE
jgi:ankyrin repeat protein